MKKVPSIPQPDMSGAHKMTPLELNALHYDIKHTLLTPEVLAEHNA